MEGSSPWALGLQGRGRRREGSPWASPGTELPLQRCVKSGWALPYPSGQGDFGWHSLLGLSLHLIGQL